MLRLNERVARRRQEMGISQAELARRVEVHQTMISAIENGKKQPALDLLVRLQDALGTLLIPSPTSAAPAESTDAEAANA